MVIKKMKEEKKFNDLEKNNKKGLKFSNFFKGKDKEIINLDKNIDKKENVQELKTSDTNSSKSKLNEKNHAFGGFFRKHKENLDNHLNNTEHKENTKEDNKEVYTDKNFDEYFKEEIKAKDEENQVKPRRIRASITLATYILLSLILPLILLLILNASITENKKYYDYAYENVAKDKSLLYVINKEDELTYKGVTNYKYSEDIVIIHNNELAGLNVNEAVKKLLSGDSYTYNNTNLLIRIPKIKNSFSIEILEDTQNLKKYINFDKNSDLNLFKEKDLFVFKEQELYNHFLNKGLNVYKINDFYVLVKDPNFIKKLLSGYDLDKISTFIQTKDAYKKYLEENKFKGNIYIDNKLLNTKFFNNIQSTYSIDTNNKKIFLVETKVDDTYKETQIRVLINFLSLLFIAIIVVAILFKDIKKDALSIKSNYVKFIIGVVICVVLLFSTNLITDFLNKIITLTTNYDLNVESVNQSELVKMFSSPANITFMFLTTVILAPIVEELIFRKVIFNIINRDNISIIVSGLLFGLIHVVSEPSFISLLIHLIPYSLSGIGLSIAYKYSKRNIFVTILGHSISNFIAVVLILSSK